MPKVVFTLKSPQGVDQGLSEIPDEETREMIKEKFFRYGEYCDIEIDTDTGEATVVPQL